MKEGPHIARIAALIGDSARAEMLSALMGGQALTATELAAVAGITKQTASVHLAKLIEARLVALEVQGRHRYHRLADGDVAQLLESLMGVAFRAGAVRWHAGPREPALRAARVCYDHLAGDAGVALYDGLIERGLLQHDDETLLPTPAGERFFSGLGVDVSALGNSRRVMCRTCLDWSARRHHLAGALGAALLAALYARGGARRVKGSRAVEITPTGWAALRPVLPPLRAAA